MSLSSSAALSVDPRIQEVRMLVELVLLARVTLLLAETGSNKSDVVRRSVMPLMREPGGSGATPVVVLFDRWDEAPLAHLYRAIDEALERLPGAGAHATRHRARADSLCASLTETQQAYDCAFVIIFDRFEDYLAQSIDRPDIREFEAQLVEAVNSRTLAANFLLVLDEDAAPLLSRLRERIPEFGDASIRLPKLQVTYVAPPAAPSAADGDRLVGSAPSPAPGAEMSSHEATDSLGPTEAGEAREAIRSALAALFEGSETSRQQYKRSPSLSERLESQRAEYAARTSRPAAWHGTPMPTTSGEGARLAEATDGQIAAASDDQPMNPIAGDFHGRHENPSQATESHARARDAEPRRPSASPIAVRIFVALAILGGVVVLGTRYADEGKPVADGGRTIGAPTPSIQNDAQPRTDGQTQIGAPVQRAGKTPLGSEQPFATLEGDSRQQAHDAAAVRAVVPPQTVPHDAIAGAREAPKTALGVEDDVPAQPASAPSSLAGMGTAAAPGNTSGPLLYIHVRSEAQRARAQRMIAPLARHGIRVSGIKVVHVGPTAGDLRYFRTTERAEALRVKRALDALAKPAHRLKYIAGFETEAPPRQFELWLPPA